MVERVLDRVLDDAVRFRGGEPVLGLALEFRLADEHREHAGGAGHHVVAGDRGGALALADALGVVLDAAQQRAAQPRIRACRRPASGWCCSRRRGSRRRRRSRRPPIARRRAADLAGAAGEDVGMHQRRVLERRGQIILQPVGEMEGGLLRHVVDAAQKLLGAGPADLDAAEQIGFGARHLEHALRPEMRLGAEDVRVGPEAHLGAAAVGRAAGLLQLALRLAALEHHAVERLLARDLDLHALGQRVGDRDADAVQAARGLVDLGVEFAAGVQRAHDHFERRLVLELRMRIDRDAAAVVGDGDEAVGLHLDFDEGGVAVQRLVHGIVDHLGEQVMQRLLVGAADIHAGTPAHRLEPLQHLDVLGGVAGLAARSRGWLRAALAGAALAARCRRTGRVCR